VVFASGVRPTTDNGWELEESLDVEWAHAMAPSAKIVLVEAASNSYPDLMAAEAIATKIVADAGGGQVSNSWGGPETEDQKVSFDPVFSHPGVAYFASSGDTPGVEFPASSPFVVAVGGTSIARDTYGNFLGETAWSSAGAGSSDIEDPPAFQKTVTTVPSLRSARGTVDIAAVADPQPGGVWVFDTNYKDNQGQTPGWVSIGGTSVAAPVIAAITNAAGRFANSSTDQLMYIYSNLGTAVFTDITKGSCGLRGKFPAATGWDYCTGVGSPMTNKGL
jgi:subtilase family serine protease